MTHIYRSFMDSPIGKILITSDEGALTGLYFEKHKVYESVIKNTAEHDTPLFQKTKSQLEEYFEGKRTQFDLPLAPHGTTFQCSVWDALTKIPYGKTRSYKEQSESINKPKAIRAVGTANGKNPISIIIPCHRVVGSDGSLTGYAGGIDAKKWLLGHEAKHK